ncbi:aminotransferase class I/II-fold pyridoxal phosphate-dependent enzyme [Desulfotruncus alcoholivorax]|uniref:aminotransferase class I/II-fold pyridoxal phosphate-dependent enzyme n=1 Tax=Desulfotruncus alcoholivorax TaxID=265477 RepID=UPI000405DA60|nr:aminotransferase class I/II-fold pyridoxal phosphate-dependent enzyme [Desulfotruncus alcoholivorax]
MYHKHGTPIISELKRYISDGVIRFHMPGHKGKNSDGNQLMELLGQKVFEIDVTNVPGMDDLHNAHDVIMNAQNLAAKTFGAEKTYFLINGSSCGLQAVLMATCNQGEKILVPRNMHRSILSGIILSGAIPVFYNPEYNSEFGISLGTSPELIKTNLQRYPDIKAVILVSPTYHGITSDIKSIAELVHSKNIPLLIDEAHGPHLYFHDELPQGGINAGADAVVQGTHKLLSAFTQASMLHVAGALINRERLEASLRLLQSTSTSYLLLASLDAARAQMEACGNRLIQKSIDLSSYLRNELRNITGLKVLDLETICADNCYNLDSTKITISLRDLGVTGFWAERWLREKHGIQVEMSDMFNLLLIITFGNSKSDVDCFLNALIEMKKYLNSNQPMAFKLNGYMDSIPVIPELAMPPRDVFFKPTMSLPIKDTAGKICSEVVACYPPGIPVIIPGEVITGEIIEYIEYMRQIGATFQGCNDTTMQTLLVVK